MKSIKLIGLLAFGVLFACSELSAAPPPASQEMGGVERTRELEARSKRLTSQIQKPKKKPGIEEEKLPSEAAPSLPSEKVLIRKINVTGATILTEKEIADIVTPYQNKELPLAEMQKVADLITDAYRTQGYITSRAYIPPQKVEGNQFEIKVIEGKMGDVEVKGNRYFKSSVFKKKIDLKQGDFFNYSKLAKSLRLINSQPDRVAKAVLAPGKEPGQTDVVLDVKDNLPLHAGFTYDDYGSRYILRNRYQFSASSNNLLGFEDMLQFMYTFSEGGAYSLIGGNYIIPVTQKLRVGASALWSKLHLLDSYKPYDVKGNSELFSLFATQSLFEAENYSINLNGGFDIKNIYNYQQGTKTSYDKMRVAKMSVDADLTDRFGRSIFTNGVEVGIPGFMGGLKAKDPHSSSVGSGGAFVKYVMNLFRLQPMPFQSNILFKNQLQTSNRPLTSTEQFQIGGIINNRGYPPAEHVGDMGFSSSTEWSFPVYGLPKNIPIPYAKTTFYNATKLVAFYDYGNAYFLKNPGNIRKKFTSLSDLGWGVRFNLPRYLTLKLDVAYPLGPKPSDGKNQRVWLSVSANF
ncbi:MAG: ShlB/FhaC/HecB family hemolysin secretion/activation protein [Candidatus Omnitrophota bacterium]